jgi:hypothetical protein
MPSCMAQPWPTLTGPPFAPAPALPRWADRRPTPSATRPCRRQNPPGPPILLSTRRPRVDHPPFVFALGQAAHGPLSSAIAARRELSPIGLHTTPTSPPMSQIGAGVLLSAPEPLLFHLFPTVGILHRFIGSGDPLAPLSVAQGTLVHCEPHMPLLLHRRPPELPCRTSPFAALVAFHHHPVGNTPR